MRGQTDGRERLDNSNTAKTETFAVLKGDKKPYEVYEEDKDKYTFVYTHISKNRADCDSAFTKIWYLNMEYIYSVSVLKAEVTY